MDAVHVYLHAFLQMQRETLARARDLEVLSPTDLVRL